MNSQQLISLSERSVRGSFQSYLPSRDAEFTLVEPVHNVSRVRVNHAFHPGGETFRAGQIYELFLVSITEGNIWYGRVGKPSTNPWLNTDLLPLVGQEVTGTVARYIEDFVAVVILDRFNEEAQLRRDALPEGNTVPIHRTLQPGDRIKAVVTNISHGDLRIELDCQKALMLQRELDLRKNRQTAQRATGFQSQRAKDGSEETDTPFGGQSILLVENDGRLRSAVVEWIKALGGNAQAVSSINQLTSCLATDRITHVVLDYNISDFDQLLATAKRSGASVAIWSAQTTPPAGAERARNEHLPFFSKPVDINDLREWVNSGDVAAKCADNSGDNTRQSWEVTHLDRAALRADARALLEVLCERHSLIGAAWARREEGSRFSFRAVTHHLPGAKRDSVERDIHRSVASRAIQTKRDLSGILAKNDPLSDFFDKELPTPHYLAIPFSDQDGHDRCVVFFSKHEWNEKVRAALIDERDNMRRIIQLTNILDHLNSTEAFATAGRLATGTLHEVKTGLLQIQALKSRMDLLLRQKKIEDALTIFRDLSKALDELALLTEFELSVVQRHRRERISVFGTVAKTVGRMNQMMKLTDNKGRSKHNATMALIGQENPQLYVSISPIVLEQPLINILDNAIYHLDDELWSRIEVEVSIDHADSDTPIHIRVSDNGPGIPVEYRAKIFDAQETSKGEKGYGLGLYISRNLVRSIGGELECVDSFRWMGSAFQIRLPVIFNSMDDQPGHSQ